MHPSLKYRRQGSWVGDTEAVVEWGCPQCKSSEVSDLQLGLRRHDFFILRSLWEVKTTDLFRNVLRSILDRNDTPLDCLRP